MDTFFDNDLNDTCFDHARHYMCSSRSCFAVYTERQNGEKDWNLKIALARGQYISPSRRTQLDQPQKRIGDCCCPTMSTPFSGKTPQNLLAADDSGIYPVSALTRSKAAVILLRQAKLSRAVRFLPFGRNRTESRAAQAKD